MQIDIPRRLADSFNIVFFPLHTSLLRATTRAGHCKPPLSELCEHGLLKWGRVKVNYLV